jgi:hypothetical protein
MFSAGAATHPSKRHPELQVNHAGRVALRRQQLPEIGAGDIRRASLPEKNTPPVGFHLSFSIPK